MKELLPLCAGFAVGGCLSFVRSARLRTALLPAACVPVGASMSWVNGELGDRLWPLFVSFDALLVWLGAVSTLFAWSLRRRMA
jgi:hypothetical protein